MSFVFHLTTLSEHGSYDAAADCIFRFRANFVLFGKQAVAASSSNLPSLLSFLQRRRFDAPKVACTTFLLYPFNLLYFTLLGSELLENLVIAVMLQSVRAS